MAMSLPMMPADKPVDETLNQGNVVSVPLPVGTHHERQGDVVKVDVEKMNRIHARVNDEVTKLRWSRYAR